MEKGNWFVALVVPEQAHLDAATAELPTGLRRFQAADLHLTVAFLGATSEARAWQAWRAIAALRHPPINVRPGSWRAMDRPGHPSAYALTLSEGDRHSTALIEHWRGPAPHHPGPATPALAGPRDRGAPRHDGPMAALSRRAQLFSIVQRRRLDLHHSVP